MERLRAWLESRSSKPWIRDPVVKLIDAGGSSGYSFSPRTVVGVVGFEVALGALLAHLSSDGTSCILPAVYPALAGYSFIAAGVLSAVQCFSYDGIAAGEEMGPTGWKFARYVLLAMAGIVSTTLGVASCIASSLLEGELLVRGLCNSWALGITTLMSIIVIITAITVLISALRSDGNLLESQSLLGKLRSGVSETLAPKGQKSAAFQKGIILVKFLGLSLYISAAVMFVCWAVDVWPPAPGPSTCAFEKFNCVRIAPGDAVSSADAMLVPQENLPYRLALWHEGYPIAKVWRRYSHIRSVHEGNGLFLYLMEFFQVLPANF